MIEDESVLSTIKEMLGLPADVTDFDQELLVHINSAMSAIMMVGGITPSEVVVYQDSTFDDLDVEPACQSMIKTYLFYKVKLGFDSANASSYLMNVWKEEAEELLWRIQNFSEFTSSYS